MSPGKKITLGKRLTQIESMVSAGYTHIWDCCCDHGLLGAALLSRQAAPHIHFVDIVPELMRELENKLHQFYPKNAAANSQWQVHCMDVSALSLQNICGKHLVIIAGVGGELMAELVGEIANNNPEAAIDFLLCPVHHQFKLRQQLIALDFRLRDECLLVENQRYYEVLLVAANQAANQLLAPINPVGSLIWRSHSSAQAQVCADYLQQTLAHYQRIRQQPAMATQVIIDAYSALTLKR